MTIHRDKGQITSLVVILAGVKVVLIGFCGNIVFKICKLILGKNRRNMADNIKPTLLTIPRTQSFGAFNPHDRTFPALMEFAAWIVSLYKPPCFLSS